MLSAKQWPFCSGLDVLTRNKIRFLRKSVKKDWTISCLTYSTSFQHYFFQVWKICLVSTPIFEKNEGMTYFEPIFCKKKLAKCIVWTPTFFPFIAFRVNGRYWAFLSNNRVPLPPPTALVSVCQWNFQKCKCHLNITKHGPWAYIFGFIELPYFGSEQFRQIYLVERICICICIWIDVFVFVFEPKLSKIFVFVFEKSKFLYILYLYLYLIKRIWPQPW